MTSLEVNPEAPKVNDRGHTFFRKNSSSPRFAHLHEVEGGDLLGVCAGRRVRAFFNRAATMKTGTWQFILEISGGAL